MRIVNQEEKGTDNKEDGSDVDDSYRGDGGEKDVLDRLCNEKHLDR